MSYYESKGQRTFSTSGLSFVAGSSPGAQVPASPNVAMSESAKATVLLALIAEVLVPLRERLDVSAGSSSTPLPSDMCRLLTGYGPREEPGLAAQTFHTGLDFYAPRGTPVFAVRPGRVELVVHDEVPLEGFIGYGTAVVLYHEDEDLWTFSAHLDEALVLPGMEVELGQVLGRVGNTTNGRLPELIVRLHFEVRRRSSDGRPPFPGPFRINSLDPEPWLASHGIDIDEKGRLLSRCPRREEAQAVQPAARPEPEPDPETLRRGFERSTPRPELFDWQVR